MAEKEINDDSRIPDFVKEAEAQLAGGEKASSKEGRKRHLNPGNPP